MRLSTITIDGAEVAAVHVPGRGLAPLPAISDDLPATMQSLIEFGISQEVRKELQARSSEVNSTGIVPQDAAHFGPLYRRPRKILGIGLNYRSHAEDLAETHPTEPASFLKGDHTIIGPGDDIVLPPQSRHVTAEAELGLVLGTECRDVDEDEALRHLVGVCPILDQTAVDILQRNPRFLTRSKNFPTFFSFGPTLVTLDEVLHDGATLDRVLVSTYRNDELQREDVVAGMAHSPQQLISLHSRVMPLFPGDIISPGSPGATRVEHGDNVECRIPGVGILHNHVVRTVPATAA